jgi:putative transposase
MDTFKASQRKACELVRIARSTFRHRSDRTKDHKLKEKLTALAQEKPRYGYRRLGVLLRRDGEVVNHKRLFRVYKEAGLSVRRKKRKRLVRVGQPQFTATANGRWTSSTIGSQTGDRSGCLQSWIPSRGSVWPLRSIPHCRAHA